MDVVLLWTKILRVVVCLGCGSLKSGRLYSGTRVRICIQTKTSKLVMMQCETSLWI